jgi:hypothetical protein
MAVIVASFLWGGYAFKTEPIVVRPLSGHQAAAVANYFNGTTAVTSISINMPGQASWLMVSSV